MSVSINLSGVEPYNGKPTTVQIDVEAGGAANQLDEATASLEQSAGSWEKVPTLYNGTKLVSVIDHVTKGTQENILAPSEASLDAGVGTWGAGDGTLSFASEGPAKNLLSFNSAMLEPTTPGSSAAGIISWYAPTSPQIHAGTKTSYIPALASFDYRSANLLDTATASFESSLEWSADVAGTVYRISGSGIPSSGFYCGLFSSDATSGYVGVKTTGTFSVGAGDVLSAGISLKKTAGSFTQAQIGIKWSGGSTTWGLLTTISTGSYTNIRIIGATAPAGTTTAQLFVRITSSGVGNNFVFDNAFLQYESNPLYFYPTSATPFDDGNPAPVGFHHGVVVNSGLNTSGVGTNRISSETISPAVTIGSSRYASAYLSTKDSAYVTSARVGIFWVGTSTIDWGSAITPSDSGWTRATVVGTAASGNTGFAVVIEFTIASDAGALAEGYFDAVSAGVGSTPYWSAPGLTVSGSAFLPKTGDGYGIVGLTNRQLTSQVIEVSDGRNFECTEDDNVSAVVSLSARDTFAQYGQIGIEWFNGGDGSFSKEWSAVVNLSAGTWKDASVSGTAPAGTTNFTILIKFTYSGGYSTGALFDRVSVNLTSTPEWSYPSSSSNESLSPLSGAIGDGYGVVTTTDITSGTIRVRSGLVNPTVPGATHSAVASLSKGIAASTSLAEDIASSSPNISIAITSLDEFPSYGDQPVGNGDYPTVMSIGKGTAYEEDVEVLAVTDNSLGSGYEVKIGQRGLNGTTPQVHTLVQDPVIELENTVTSGRIGIQWQGPGTIEWGDPVSIDDAGTWYEATLEGAIAPAGTTGWYVFIEYETTGPTNAAYFDKVAAVSGGSASYGDGIPKILSITRSTVGYPGEVVVYDSSFIGSYTYYDRAVPLDCSVTYNLSYGSFPTREVASASITLDGVPEDDQVCYPCLISDPKNTDYIQAATLQIYRPFEYQERMSINDVIGSAYPIALSGKRSAARGSITMITHTQRQADMMRTMFSTGRSLMFRVMSEARPEKPAIAIAVSKVAEEPVILPHISRPERKWNIDFVEIALPVVEQLFVTENTWAGIVASYLTWGGLVANSAEASSWYFVVSNPDVIS